MSGLKPPPFRVDLKYKEDGQFEWLKTNIDTPVDQRTLNSLVCEVAGWVAYFPGTDEPLPVSVVVGVGDFGWLETPIELNRPDVRQAQIRETGREVLTDLCGFSLQLPVYMVRSGGPYKVFVRCRSGSLDILHEIADISFKSSSANSWKIPGVVQPLIVNSVGRSGSSLLCRMLDMHPKVHVPTGGDQFGEISICEYACRIVSTLSSEGSYPLLNRVGDSPDFLQLEPPHICSAMLRNLERPEFQHAQMQRVLTEGARALATSVFSNYIAYVQSDKPWLRYVAEKSWNSYNLNVLELLFDAPKEVFIVRSPTEFLRSQTAFLRKQGAKPDHILKQHLATADRLGNLARSRADRHESSHVVKFEELVADTKVVLEGLASYLSLDITDKYLSDVVAIIGDDSSHSRMLRTEKSDASSDDYGKYCSMLSSTQMRNLSMFCEEFGYPSPPTA